MSTNSDNRDLDELRLRCRAARRLLTSELRHRATSLIADSVLSILAEREPGRIALYVAHDGEPDPGSLAPLLRSSGWMLYLPVVSKGYQMRFGEWISGSPLVDNKFGIGEPDGDVPTLTAGELDVVVVPCVAIDESRNRLGMGAGFYDRALQHRLLEERTSGPLLIGVAFEVQVLPEIRTGAWDVPLDVAVTESRVVA